MGSIKFQRTKKVICYCDFFTFNNYNRLYNMLLIQHQPGAMIINNITENISHNCHYFKV